MCIDDKFGGIKVEELVKRAKNEDEKAFDELILAIKKGKNIGRNEC